MATFLSIHIYGRMVKKNDIRKRKSASLNFTLFWEELFLLFKMQAQSHEKRQVLSRMRGKAAMVKLIDYIRYAPLAIKQMFWEIRYK